MLFSEFYYHISHWWLSVDTYNVKKLTLPKVNKVMKLLRSLSKLMPEIAPLLMSDMSDEAQL